MAQRTISTRLAIEGESQYKQAVATINGELKTMQSALKLVESEYKNNANSMQALTAKSDALTKVYASQQQKVDTLKSALENAQKAQQTYASRIEDTKGKIAAVEKEMADLANSTGDTTARQAELKAELERLNKELVDNEAKAAAAQKGVNNWERQLNNAKVELNNINGEIDKNATYMDEAKASTDGCATSIDRFGKESKEAKEESAQFGKTSKEAVDTLSAALVAAGLTRALKEIADTITACTDASIEFESALTGVFKTVEGTEQQLAAITEGIKNMALEIPATTTELAGIGEMAGQLGIHTDRVIEFTRVMADLGETTNISSAEGAKQLAQFANIVRMSQADFNKLGSTIVALGNNFATTEADILAMAQRLAGAGKQIGLTEAEIMGFAAALSSVGIEAEAGGSAFSRVFADMQVAVETGKESLTDFAMVAGMTAEEFKTAFRQDAAGAITAFIEGLSKMSEQGISSIATLEEMGITQLRLRDSLLRTSNAGDLVRRAMEMGNTAWKENTALATEAALRYGTTESKLQLLKNAAEGTKRAIGDVLAPALRNIAEAGTDAFEWATEFVEQNPWMVKALTAVAAALGVATMAVIGYTAVKRLAIPVITAFNTALASNPIGAVALAIGMLVAALGTLIVTSGDMTTAADALNERMEASKRAYDESVAAINTEVESVDALISALTALSEKENKTAADKAALAELVDQLNEKVPELTLAYDEQTDSLNMTAGAIKAMAKAMADAARQQRAVERLTELYIEQEDIAELLAQRQDELTEANEKYAAAVEAADPALVGYDGSLNNLSQTVPGLEADIARLTEVQEANKAAIGEAEASINAYAAAAVEAGDSSLLMANSVMASMTELEAAYQLAYDAAYDSITDQIGLFETLDGTADQSVKDLIGSLQSQIDFMETYAENINKAMELGVDKGLVEKLSDGSEASAKILAAIVADGGKNVGELNIKLAEVEEGKRAFSEEVALMQTEFDEKMGEIEQRLGEAITEMNKAEDAATAGADTIGGYVDGAESMRSALVAKFRSLAEAANRAYKEALDQRSPSKVMMQSGKDTVQGIIEGARSKENELRLEMQRMSALMVRSIPDVSRITGITNNQTTNLGGLNVHVHGGADRQAATSVGRSAGNQLALKLRWRGVSRW